MILPTLWITMLARSGNDRYGHAILAPAGRLKVAPVKIIFSDEHTTVRTDSSGSHGSAMETDSDVVLLALPKATVKRGDVLEVLGRRVVVKKTHHRYTVLGRHDHTEIHCDSWAE